MLEDRSHLPAAPAKPVCRQLGTPALADQLGAARELAPPGPPPMWLRARARRSPRYGGPGRAGLRQYDAAAASLAQAERLAAGGCFAFLAVPWRWLEVTMLVLPGHLAAEQA